MSRQSDNDNPVGHGDGQGSDIIDELAAKRARLSDYQVELLRQALVEYGKRLTDLEVKMDNSMADIKAVKELIRRTQDRLKVVANELDVDLSLPGDSK